MITHELIQGSPQWHQHRALYFNASDAPAMMGCSPYTTRTQLLHRLHTGITPEVDAGTQARFNDGHRFEALARPLAEAIIGQDLYPVVGSDGGLSASFDGLTMDESICFEHKSLNADLADVLHADCKGFELPLQYQVQMEQQLLVSSAERCLFMASKWAGDELVEERHCWYASDPALRLKIIDGWRQLAADLAAYVPTEAVVAPIAKMAATLPVVFDMRVEGKLVSCNIDQYKPAAMAYIAAINTDLVTDQNFADADADAKFCRESAKKLELAIEQGLGQMGDINRAIVTVREIAAAFNAKGLALEKNVKAEKDNRKIAIIQAGRKALQAHESSLQERTQHYLPPGLANFETVVKGLKTITSIQNAVDTELARCKIEANAVADKIQTNLNALTSTGYDELFPDERTLVLKAPDDLVNIIAVRITTHQAKEAARIESERARIRQEEVDRLAREQAAADRAVMDKLQATYATAKPSEPLPVVKLTQTIPRAQAPVERSQPTLKLGTIAERLGFNLNGAFISELGIEPAAKMNNATLYHEADFERICRALITHIEGVFAAA